MKCYKCGAMIPDGNAFCGSCGAPAPVVPAEEPKPEVPVKEEPAAVEPVVKEPIAEETAPENEPGLSKEDISKAVADAIKESNLQAMQMENLRLQGMVSGIGFRYPCDKPP